jgi:hypothetical protein
MMTPNCKGAFFHVVVWPDKNQESYRREKKASGGYIAICVTLGTEQDAV